MLEALEYPFFQRALMAGVLASLACGVVGTFVVVKRIASISGGLSHAAFGGVGLGYWLGFEPTLGAVIFALLGGIGIGAGRKRLGNATETAISIMWAAGMALGILFISFTPGYAPDLMSYLFGGILFVPMSYVYYVAALNGLILLVVLLFFKELQAVAFDEEFAQIMGVPAQFFYVLLLALVALAIVILIKIVGIILVIALLTVPAATARQWAQSLGQMMLGASLFGSLSVITGLFLAYWLSDVHQLEAPAGPLIILLALVVYGVSSILKAIRTTSRRRQAGA
ncbi:MAG: metal ABC transporter permease [Candidatus Eisenbacteria bacterium]|uniref:Metal ABC transporter permease n=1 Tax=Eiseniibacteriota bacterium TaxID=2212470 RepID=A0A7Y2E660_UNCEI|nr:metal ABC transporter permease [Candidatus Eisenbacteria bacterium]